jgi:rSAM/selenodomain-associated transferase 1
MANTPYALVIFAKYPEPGQVKTRLAADIGAEKAAELYREFLRTTVEKATTLNAIETIVAYTPPQKREEFAGLLNADCRLEPQREGDLGQRMAAVFSELLPNHSRVVIIGADSPTLPAGYLREAFAALSTADLVLGPTEDGGYYLVGLRSPQPQIFADIVWSTPTVFASTLERAKASGLQWHLLPTWHDVDTLTDLRKALLYDDGTLRVILQRTGLTEAAYTCFQAPSSGS